ncbi:hypothetical protein GF378_00870, partial [Candidatus Pacearchaeota archaeon]|nr:hypothetical protein [Candidatus Pacearchaeota archaeon]
MSHKRVVKKRGKTYGPYLYESYRDENGNVKKRYLGKAKKEKKNVEQKHFSWGFLFAALIFLMLIFSGIPFTGRATLSLDNVGNDGNVLTGDFDFVLQQSELIPENTDVLISTPSNDYSYSLKDLINEETTEGDFYISDADVSGYGSGYSASGERFPLVSFVLGIYGVVESNDTRTTPIEEPSEPIVNDTEGTDNEANQTEENEGESGNESGNETGSNRDISMNANVVYATADFLSITGHSTLELVEEVSGSVRANESFTYDLEEGQEVEILSSEQDITLQVDDESNEAIVTTDYLGEQVKNFSISLDELNISAESGTLNVRFVHDGEEILSGTKEIDVVSGETTEEPEETSNGTRSTPIESPLEPIINETEENETVRGVQAGESVSIELVNPSSNTEFNKNYFNEFTINVTCVSGPCGTVNVTLDPYEVEGDDRNKNSESDGTRQASYDCYGDEMNCGSVFPDGGANCGDYYMWVDDYVHGSAYYQCDYDGFNCYPTEAETCTVPSTDYYLYDAPSGVSYVDSGGTTIDHVDYSVDSRFYLSTGGFIFAEMNATSDVSLSGANANSTGLKSVVHLQESGAQNDVNYIKLIIERKSGGPDDVIVCPDVTSLSQIYPGCTSESILNPTNDTDGTYALTYDADYWYVQADSAEYLTGIQQLTKGIVPTTPGSIPFYTNKSSNPYTTSSLSTGQSELVTFWVNATGDAPDTYEFFAYANMTSNESVNDVTDKINITIQIPNVPPTIDYLHLNSTFGTNFSTEDLYCQVQANDENGDNLAYGGEWYKNEDLFVGELWNQTDSYHSSINDRAYDIAVDNSSNTYVTGQVYNGSNYNIYVIKYNSSGIEQWNASYDSGEHDYAYGIAVDSSGDVYVTGEFYNTTAINNWDWVTVKFNSTGDYQWNSIFSSPFTIGGYDDEARAIVADDSGNIYVTGQANNLTGDGTQDWHTIKYNGTDGSEIWNATYNGGGQDEAYDIALDSQENIYVSGISNIAGSKWHLRKYNSTGDYQWNATFDGSTAYTAEVAINTNDSVFITGSATFDGGSTYDYHTIKYDSEGNHQYNFSSDSGATTEVPYSIVIDAMDNIYLTGYAVLSGRENYFTVKHNSTGSHIWNRTYNAGDDSRGQGVAVDSSGNVYVTGYAGNTTKDNWYTIKYLNGFVSLNNLQGQSINVSELDNSFTSIGDNWTCSLKAYDGENYSTINTSSSLTILNRTEYEPTTTGFTFSDETGEINFSDTSVDLSNVVNVSFNNSQGKISFPAGYGLNVLSQNYTSNVNIGGSFVSVNTSALHSSFNNTANITFFGVNCNNRPNIGIHYTEGVYNNRQDILSNSVDCVEEGICSEIVCDGSDAIVEVSHFTGYAIGNDANLTIWDEGDSGVPYGDNPKLAGEDIKFFANYSNSSGVIQGATCIIDFYDSSNNVMDFNSSLGGFYEYNRTFSSVGTYDYNVTCNKTGYTTLNASDNTTISSCSCSSCSGCESSLENPACSQVNLTQNINVGGSACISVSGLQDKEFDCQNYQINFNSQSATGIGVSDSDNFTITRCNIRNLAYALDFNNVSNSVIYDNIFFNNTFDTGGSSPFAISLQGDNNSISTNDIYGNFVGGPTYYEGTGIYMSGTSENNTFYNNYFQDVQTAIEGSSNSDYNNFTSNTIERCSWGIKIGSGSKYNHLESNNIEYVEYNSDMPGSFRIQGSNHTLIGNSVDGTSNSINGYYYAFYINAANVILRENFAQNVGGVGFYINDDYTILEDNWVSDVDSDIGPTNCYGFYISSTSDNNKLYSNNASYVNSTSGFIDCNGFYILGNSNVINDSYADYNEIGLDINGNNNNITNTYSSDNDIGLKQSSGTGNNFYYNSITYNSGNGVELEVMPSIFEFNEIEGNYDNGLYADFTGGSFWLSSNNFTNNANSGIVFDGPDNNNITNNIIYGGNYGINMTSASINNLIYNNDISGTAYDAVDLGSNDWNTTYDCDDTSIVGGCM